MESIEYPVPKSTYGQHEINMNGSFAEGAPYGFTGAIDYQKSQISDPLSEDNLKRFFEAMFTLADEHRKPREVIWEKCWQLYNNQYDFSAKAWWQHKVPIPKVREAVDKAVTVFRKTLLRMYPFYGIQSESKLGRTKGRYSMLLTDYWFDQINIVKTLVTTFKVGLITSVAANKIWMAKIKDTDLELKTQEEQVPNYEFGVITGYTTTQKRKFSLKPSYKAQLAVATVNPVDIWVVPGTNGRAIIERTELKLNEIIALSKGPDAVFDAQAVERLINRTSQKPEVSDEKAQTVGEGPVNVNNYFKTITLWTFWGDIYDIEGNLILCDATFSLADRDILIKPASENQFFHKNPPFVIGSPYEVPFSTYNRGMVEDIGDIAISICEMSNLIADGALYDAMKAFSIDVDQLEDPTEAKQGIYPGKAFLRRSSNSASPNEELVQTVNVGSVPQESMNMIGLFERYFQEASYINEWVGGNQGRGTRTLGEANLKTQSALEGLDESARHLEITCIEPTVKMAAQVIYQFQANFMLQRLVDNYPQISIMLQEMTPEERYVVMLKDFSFRVRGLSVMIDRQQRIGELKELLTLLSYLPGFLEQLDPQATMEEILMPIGWDPRRLLINGTASGVVSNPTAGAAPSVIQPPPPGVISGNTPIGNKTGQNAANPMQQRNAQEGAALGGSRNNPNSIQQQQQRPNTNQQQQALQFFLRNAMAKQQTQGFFGR